MSVIAAIAILAATASATVRVAKVEVGDPVPVTVKVTARPGSNVTIFPPRAEPGAFDVEESAPRLLQADATGIVSWTFDVVPWADGEITVPPMRVDVSGQGSVNSNAITLRGFNPLGAKAKDATPADIRDIREFPSAPPWWIFILAGAIVGGALLALSRRKPAAPPKRAKPKKIVPVRTLADAIDDVRRIAEHPPRAPEEIREAHFVVAEAIRRFVEE
ncbi:MAG TPA: BatD family protein, partial [bacterium]|nr:BatD family protein [bacterium]